MGSFFQRPLVRRIRILFRWCRIFVWLTILLAVALVAYVHLVGLPDMLKRPLLQRLLASDIAAEFSNMQLGWRRGPSIIIENASFSRSDQSLSPRLTTRRAELVLDWHALCRARIHARSLEVVDAEWRVPVSESPGDALVLNNLALDMRFDSNDVVRLEKCRGVFRGTQIDLLGKVTHVKDMRQWKIFVGEGGEGGRAFQARLRDISRVVQKIHFTGMPLLQIETGADGLDMNSFHAEMHFGAAAADTPWGTVTNLACDAACNRLVDPGAQPFFQVTGSATSIDTHWAQGRKVSFSTSLSRAADSNLTAEIRFDAARFNAAWKYGGDRAFGAARVWWNGSVTLASSNRAPLTGGGHLRATGPRTPWGLAQAIALDFRIAPTSNAPVPGPEWGPWADFAPWTLDCQVDASKVVSPKLRFDRLSFSGHWRAPQVSLENLKAELYGGRAVAAARLDISSRELHCNGRTDFDPHSVSQVFQRPVQEWLAQLEWSMPPKVNAELRVVLPPWTNRPPDWGADVDSSLQIAGNFAADRSAFDKVQMLAATGHVTYTNRTWHVTQLHAVRPDGEVDLDYTTSEAGFHYIVDSKMDPKAALPLVAPGQPHLLDSFDFHQPPVIHSEIWGSWHEEGRTGVTGTVRAKDFTYRGEPVSVMNASVVYTNLLIDVRDFQVSNSLCHAQSTWIHIDLGKETVQTTNANGTLDPRLLQHLLRPNVPDWLDAVYFDSPPTISASGSFYLTNSREANLHFMVSGQGAHYTNLVADRASANVDWVGSTVIVTNIAASLYKNGSLMGWIVFPSAGEGPDFQANFTARDVDLSALATGITGKTSKIEGRLDADLDLSGPNSKNSFDWKGRGRIHVHDGLLWDIKVFGLLSPVLNLISPGWGHSRAKEASGDFVISNGVISSDDVVVRCQGFRILMRGTVDKSKRINARMEAVLSREVPVFGSFLSIAFTPLSKLFEYRVAGPVNDPSLEPIYVPKFIMYMLHPFHTIKSLSTPETPSAPPDKK